MISWQFLINLQDGNGQRDITALVRDESVTRVQRLYNKLAPVSSSISFEINYNSTIFPLLISQKKDILLEVNREAAAFFTGVVRPTFTISSKNIGPSGAGDTVTFEGLDYSYYLDRVHGWNGQNNLEILSKKVCDPADQSNSAVHLILAQAGITNVGSLPTITDLVSLTIPTSISNAMGTGSNVGSVGFDGSLAVQQNIAGGEPTGKSATYLPYLKDLLFDFGYTFYFTEAGNFQTYLWDVVPASVSTTDTATQSNIQSYTLQREDYVPDRYDVTYTNVATNNAGALVDATRQKSDASSATFTGVVDLGRIGSYREILKYSVVLEFQYGQDGAPVGGLYRRVVSTTDTFPVVLMKNSTGGTFYTGKSVTAFTVDAKGNYSITVTWTGTGNQSTVTKNEIYAIYTYAESVGVKSKHTGTTYRPQSYTAKYIDNSTDALAFAAALAQYGTASQTKVRLNSSAEYSLGEYVALTEPLNGLSAVKLRVIERTDSAPVDTNGNFLTWRYVCDPIETISTTTDTEVANAPTLSTRGLEGPDPRVTEAVSIITVKPQDGTSYTAFSGSYIQWDPQTETLEVAGDLYLSGNSTLQGTVAVGGAISSTNYVADTSGWSILASGAAEFYSIKLRGTIDAAGAVLGGYTITSTALYAGTGAARIQLDTTAGIHLGATAFASAPFSVTLAGALKSTSGTIGGFFIGSDYLSSAGVGVARLNMNKGNSRFEVLDSSNVVKVAMGYLNGLAKNDGSGNWTAADYGFYAVSGDKLRIDGDAEYIAGDWIIQSDASYQILNGSTVVARLGTLTGERGLFINEAETTNYRAKLTGSAFRVGDNTNYIDYSSGALTIKVTSFKIETSLTSALGAFKVSSAGTIDALTNPLELTTEAVTSTYGRINHATSVRLATGGTDRVTVTSGGNVLVGHTNNGAGTKLNVQETSSGAAAAFLFGEYYGPLIASGAAGASSSYYAFKVLVNGNGNAGGTSAFEIRGNGNVLVGTTTDSGYKLRVNGTSYFDSDMTVYAKIGFNTMAGGSSTTLDTGYQAQVNGNLKVSQDIFAAKIGVGSAGTVDSGYEFQVNGDAKVTGNLAQDAYTQIAYLGQVQLYSHGTGSAFSKLRAFNFDTTEDQAGVYTILNALFSGDGAIPCLCYRVNLGAVGVYIEKSGTTIYLKDWSGNTVSTFASGVGTAIPTDHYFLILTA